MTKKKYPFRAEKDLDIELLQIKGARENNLQNVSVDIPRGKFVVITGPSGSGKSSLAFNVIYSEGQRRYLEGLSAHARNYLDIASKPDVDAIENLSPTIAIDQKSVAKNPRSTVGTLTEMYDYFRVLFAKAGQVNCPSCGDILSKKTVRQILEEVIQFPDKLEVSIYARLRGRQEDVVLRLGRCIKEGYVSGKIKKERVVLNDVLIGGIACDAVLDVLIDRFISHTQQPDKERILDSLEEAFKMGEEIILVVGDEKEKIYQKEYTCSACHVTLPDFTARSFSFNNPEGACENCSGIGERLTIQPDRLVTSGNLTLEEGAIMLLSRFAGKMGKRGNFWDSLDAFANRENIDLSKPFKRMSKKEHQKLLFGDGIRRGDLSPEHFPGIIPFLEDKYLTSTSENLRKEMEEFMQSEICSSCDGMRLRWQSLSVTIEGRNIAQWTMMTLDQLMQELEKLIFDEGLYGDLAQSLETIVYEIVLRLAILQEVGLGYLMLNRTSVTLSGGEGQRIRLAMQLVSKLSGVMYVLDEPSMGLHARDTQRLIGTLKQLCSSGNSLIVVEHDRDIMESAEWIVDMGPGAGEEGGRVMFSGTHKQLLRSKTLTAQYLSHKKKILCKQRKVSFDKCITLQGAREHNLQNIDVSFPLNVLTVVTGVSGSGKSTLMSDIFSKAIRKHFYAIKDTPGQYDSLTGLEHINKVITINQEPIGRTSRSNVATYSGVFSLVRDVFAQTPLAESRRYNSSRFSFNLKGGRCEECQGEGKKKIEMYLMPDIYVDCDICSGTRYNMQTLEVEYHGVSISDVLDMSVSYAKEFFAEHKLIREKLEVLEKVGLGYLHLGQGAPDLSGGEAQRIKLATELARKSTGDTLYILDEPTIGLHFEDISRLLFVLNSLIDRGNTVIVVEHNTEVIQCADWVIDLGPEGGDKGGKVVFSGTPQDLKKCKESWTGKFLA